jgi:predicted anti-sigma-YlaC factor YlaD
MPSDCPPLELLAAFLDHELRPEEQAAVEHHLAECRTCREVIKAALPSEDEPGEKSE